ncbi:hypothetical protein ACKXGF_07440 [Alkalibacillus sp. S2W]|uniref:hypothetical protein n=1 Tax=Alkalibacillus sp. S2W TaxID=3386553 RepID=UPI00398C9D83
MLFEIKNRNKLEKEILEDNYDKILVWKDGTWNYGTGEYVVSIDDDSQPVAVISRVHTSGMDELNLEWKLDELERNINQQIEIAKEMV